MKNIISLKDLEKMVRAGQDVKNLPSDAILTPSARDYLQEIELRGLSPRPCRSRRNGRKNFRARQEAQFQKLQVRPRGVFQFPLRAQLEGADLRDGPPPLEARLRGRQRRQHGHPRRRRHRHLHAHARQQRLAQAVRHVPRGFRGQPASAAQKAHERNPDAPCRS
jgi:hypothetical protein